MYHDFTDYAPLGYTPQMTPPVINAELYIYRRHIDDYWNVGGQTVDYELNVFTVRILKATDGR